MAENQDCLQYFHSIVESWTDLITRYIKDDPSVLPLEKQVWAMLLLLMMMIIMMMMMRSVLFDAEGAVWMILSVCRAWLVPMSRLSTGRAEC